MRSGRIEHPEVCEGLAEEGQRTVAKDHPILTFAGVLKDLAEGRMEPGDWLAWWNEHSAEVESISSPGWFLALKPKGFQSGNPFDPILSSQSGACHILKALEVPFEASQRYSQSWREEFERFCAAEKAKKAERTKKYRPMIVALSGHFPRFASFLKRRAADIEEMEPPASEAQVAEIEASLGLPLPDAYKRLLLCTGGFSIRQLDFRSHHRFVHRASPGSELPTEAMLCFAQYWLEADGDQVLFDVKRHPGSDPPVFYYAHEALPPQVRRIAASFTEWIESLPRSPMFR
jgi:hypothetical protein